MCGCQGPTFHLDEDEGGAAGHPGAAEAGKEATQLTQGLKDLLRIG
jgi:hypothetical protein